MDFKPDRVLLAHTAGSSQNVYPLTKTYRNRWLAQESEAFWSDGLASGIMEPRDRTPPKLLAYASFHGLRSRGVAAEGRLPDTTDSPARAGCWFAAVVCPPPVCWPMPLGSDNFLTHLSVCVASALHGVHHPPSPLDSDQPCPDGVLRARQSPACSTQLAPYRLPVWQPPTASGGQAAHRRAGAPLRGCLCIRPSMDLGRHSHGAAIASDGDSSAPDSGSGGRSPHA